MEKFSKVNVDKNQLEYSSSSECSEQEPQLRETLRLWVGTFKNEIGKEAKQMTKFSQFHDGILLYKLVRAVTDELIDKPQSKQCRSPQNGSDNSRSNTPKGIQVPKKFAHGSSRGSFLNRSQQGKFGVPESFNKLKDRERFREIVTPLNEVY